MVKSSVVGSSSRHVCMRWLRFRDQPRVSDLGAEPNNPNTISSSERHLLGARHWILRDCVEKCLVGVHVICCHEGGGISTGMDTVEKKTVAFFLQYRLKAVVLIIRYSRKPVVHVKCLFQILRWSPESSGNAIIRKVEHCNCVQYSGTAAKNITLVRRVNCLYNSRTAATSRH